MTDRAQDAADRHHRRRCARRVDGANGASAVLVYVPHTTAGVTINEHIDPDARARPRGRARADRRRRLGLAAHRGRARQNAPSHVRASLMGPQVLVPLADGTLALGTLAGDLLLRVRRAARRARSTSRRCSSACVTPPATARRAVAAPVDAGDEELELRIDSLAYGGNGVARLDGFVVFVRRGLPGRPRARARDEGEAQPRRGDRRRRARAGPAARRGAVRALPGLRRLPLPGSRVRGAARGEGGAGRATRCARIGGHRRAAARADRPGRVEVFHYRNKLEYSFTQTPDGPALGFHRAGRWDEVLDIEQLLAHDRPRQRDPRRRRATGRARSGSRRTTRPSSTGYLRHLVVREGRNTGQVLVQLVTAPRRALRPRTSFVEVLRALPGGALDPLVGQRRRRPR